MTKERIIRKAQETANRERRAIAVLNLNRYSPLYVMRNWEEGLEKVGGFVAKVVPEMENHQ